MPVIPLGEFALSRVTPRADTTRVDMSPLNVAGRGAAAVGEALTNTGQQLGQMATQEKAKQTQESEALARAKAANASLDRERQVNALKLETADKLDAKEIDPEKVDSYFSEQLTKIKTPELPDLEPHVREAFNGGIGRTDAEAKDAIAHLVRVGKRKALRDQFPAGLQIIEQSAQQPGADFEKLIKQADQLRAAGTLGAWSESEIEANITNTHNLIATTAAESLVARDPEVARDIFGKRLNLPGQGSQQAQLRAAFEVFDAEQATGDPNAQAHLDDAIKTAGGVGEFEVNIAPGGETKALSSLSVQQAVQFYNKADAAVRRAEAEAKQTDDAGRVTFRQSLQDTETALRNGEVVPIPDMATASRYLGDEAGSIAVNQLQVLQSMAGAMATLKTATPAETKALLEQYQPSGTDNRQAKQQAYEMLTQQAARLDTERKADPGQYVLDHAPLVSSAFKRYVESTLGANLDPMSAQAQTTARTANREYLTLSIAEQNRLGIASAKLPKLYVAAVAADFKANLIKNPQGTVARLAHTGRLLQDTPMALDQLAAAVGPAGVLALEGVDATTVQKVADVSAVTEADRKKLLPATVKWADLEKSVAQVMAPLTRTFVAQNAASTATRYNDAAMKLAYARVVELGESKEQAAAEAYRDLILDRYHPIDDTYRIPREQPLEAVQAGLQGFLQQYDPKGLRIAPEPGFTREESAARKWRTASTSGRWVNNDTDSGVYLYGRDGLPVLTQDGKPLFVTFENVIRYAPARRALGRRDPAAEATLRGRR